MLLEASEIHLGCFPLKIHWTNHDPEHKGIVHKGKTLYLSQRSQGK